jgi:hypothetical protein
MIQSTVSRKANDIAKWTKALERAITEALDVLVEPISGEAFVESATRPGILYHVSAQTCSSPAGQKGQVCKHRAYYLAQIGELPLASVVIIDVPTKACPSCTNGRIEEWGVSGPIGCKPCPVCGGSGRITALPAVAPEPQRMPLVAA